MKNCQGKGLTAVVFCLLVLAIGVLLFFTDPYISELPTVLSAFYLGDSKEFMIATVVALLSFATVLVGICHRNTVVRISFLLLVAATSSLHSAYSSVVRRPIELFDVQLAEREAGFALDALQSYQSAYLPKLGLFFLVGLVLYLLSKLSPKSFGWSFCFILPLTLLCNLHFLRHKEGVRPIAPSVFSMPLIWAKNTFTSRYVGPRAEPIIQPAGPGKAKTIVLIIDESIRGDILSINGYSAPTTPYLEQIPLVNFGIASSSTNCSAPSHHVLRNGLRQDQLPDATSVGFKIASIFQYAHQAGYRTVLIEGQKKGGRLQDFLSRYDLDSIDSFRYFDEFPKCEKSGDCFIVQEIAAAVRSSKPAFVLAIKEGAHVPYQKNYPPEHAVFSPSLAPREDLSDRPRALNSYYNAIRWTVDDFFAQLLQQIADQDYLIVYTSDHGQNILETSNPITHCSKKAAGPGEGVVPLLLFSSNQEIRALFQPYAEQKKDKATHFEIYPTLLWALGYPEERTKEVYGPSLKDSDTNKQLFFSGHVLGEGSGTWNSIEGRASISSSSL